MGIDGHLGAGQPGTVDDGGVVEFVGHDANPGPAQNGEDPEVGGEPGREHQGSLGVLPIGQLRLQLVVHRSGAADQPRGPGAGTPAVGGGGRRFDHRRMGAEAEVVVGGERDDGVGTVIERTAWAERIVGLRRAPTPGGLDGVGPFGQVITPSVTVRDAYLWGPAHRNDGSGAEAAGRLSG